MNPQAKESSLSADTIDNLKALLSVGERILATEDLPIAFGSYKCNTHGCWFGWYWTLSAPELKHQSHDELPVRQHFGITEEQSVRLFSEVWVQQNHIRPQNYPADHSPNSPEARRELARRMRYLRKMISRRESSSKGGSNG